jgi:hypothetical protein
MTTVDPDEPIDEMIAAADQAIDRELGYLHRPQAEVLRVIIGAALAVFGRDRAVVDPADLRMVLAQRVMHCHEVPGRWDKDGSPCTECAARERLRASLPGGAR